MCVSHQSLNPFGRFAIKARMVKPAPAFLRGSRSPVEDDEGRSRKEGGGGTAEKGAGKRRFADCLLSFLLGGKEPASQPEDASARLYGSPCETIKYLQFSFFIRYSCC